MCLYKKLLSVCPLVLCSASTINQLVCILSLSAKPCRPLQLPTIRRLLLVSSTSTRMARPRSALSYTHL